MTEQTAIIITSDYGSSLSTPTLRHHLTAAEIATADSANELSDASGWYALVFTESAVHAAGWYALRAFVSGSPINRFVYFTGQDGETAIAVDNLPVELPQTGQVIVTRPVGDDTPITFSFPVASATLTGTRRINNAGSTTAISGTPSFLRTAGTKHLYSLSYNAADRLSDDGVVEYVFTDGTYSRTVVLKAVTAVLDSAAILAVADQVWDEAMSGHTTAGTYGGRIVRATNSNTEVQITGSNHIAADVHEFQTGVITAGDFAANSITASALATDAVTEIQSGLASQSSVNTLATYVDTEVAAIKAKTDNLPADPADQSLVEAAITAATSPLATPAQVNAEVVDVLSVDTFAELSAPPAATSSLKDKLTWLFMYARNKVTQTATTRTLYRDDTTTVAGTSGTSDNGTTFTKGEDA